MQPTSTAREVNRRLLLSLHQDGVPDLLAGILVADFGLIPVLDDTGLSPGLRQVILLSVYFLQLGILILVRKHITQPRAGTVVLKKNRRNRMATTFLLANVTLFLTLIGLYIFRDNNREFMENYGLSLTIGGIYMVLLTTAGLVFRAARFYLYSLLVGAAYFSAGYLHMQDKVADYGIPIAAFLSGGLIFVAGTWLLIRFLGGHPIERS